MKYDWDRHFRHVSHRRRNPASFGADFGGVNPNVLAVQKTFNRLGVQPPLKEDGIWGPNTQSAVLAFQRNSGLTPTAVIDAATLAKLGITPQKLPPIPTTPLAPIPGIKQVVVETFPAFSKQFEGKTNYPYTDIKGFVSIGIGNLIDPVSLALSLPFTMPDGSPASPSQIQTDFQKLKDNYKSVIAATGNPPSTVSQQGLTQIRLSDQAIANLMAQKMRGNHQVLLSDFPNYASWPADAQLALHSLSWAWGPAFARVWGQNGTAFKQAVNQSTPDFAKAADIVTQASQKEESINAGIKPRDLAQQTLFANAAAVIAQKGDGDSLFYPNFVSGALAFVQKHVALSIGAILGICVAILGIFALGGQKS